MMQINRNNYEVFFIDYYDGALNAEQKAGLQRFLASHPDLKQEFEEFGQINVEVPGDMYLYKENLKKNISDRGMVSHENIDEYCIAFIENDLEEDEKADFLDALEKKPGFKEILRQYRQTVQQADESLIFQYKKQLKHISINRRLVISLMGMASAAAIVILGLFIIKPSEHTGNENKPLTGVLENVDSSLQTKHTVGSKGQVTELDNVVIKKEGNFVQQITKDKSPVKEVVTEKPVPGKSVILAGEMPNGPGKLQPEEIQNIELPEKELDIITAEHENMLVQQGVVPVKDDQLVQATMKKPPRKRGFNLWLIAETGLKVIGKLNETTIEIEPAFLENGKLKSVTLTTEKREITAPAI